LHTDKDHQMPFVGGPNTRNTDARWRTASILEKSKNRHLGRGSSDFDGISMMTQFNTLDAFDR